jgi:transcriptional regulator with GAF, ATPase, and Fis domain
VFPIELAPLRERSEDVADLANHFLRRIARELGLDGLELGSDQLAALRRHSWPGNVREIRTVLERVVIRACNGPLEFPKRLGASTPTSTDQGQAPEARELTLGRLRELERELVWRALEKCDGRIYGPSGAAAALGLKPTTLASKMKRYGFLRSQREVSWSLTASID